MAECPFCGSGVTEDLVTYGGTCPKCFAEIPGEEAATDPGVEVRALIERRDRRRATIRVASGLLVLVVIVACAGVTALATVLWPEPQVAEILDFDTLTLPTPPELASADPVDPVTATGDPARLSAADRAAKFGSGPTVERGGGTGLGSDPTSSGSTPPRVRTTLGPLGGPSSPIPSSGTRAPGGLADLTLDAPKVRRDDNLVLSDPEAIREMIGERLVEFIPGLQLCYDRRLKAVPSLKGRWRVKFVIDTAGGVTNADAIGVDRRDAELESCLEEHIREHWRFGKITIAQPVQRTVTFSH